LEPAWVQSELAGDAEGRYAICGDPTRGTRSVGATEGATTGALWLKHEDSSDGSDGSGLPPRRQQKYTDTDDNILFTRKIRSLVIVPTVAWNSVAE